MISNFQEEKPVILIVSESKNKLRDLVINYLSSESLEIKSLDLDEDFFLKYEDLTKTYKSIYKLVFIYGFDSCNKDVYERVFSFIFALNRQNLTSTQLVLLSSFSTPLKILDESSFKYSIFLDQQKRFLLDFYKKFPESQIFLAQDLLLDSKLITYPLLLYFSALNKNCLIDPQNKFYFQDEKGFFDLIKQHLVRPHKKGKFLIKGKAVNSEKIVGKIKYLVEQYFQRELNIIKLISEPVIDSFFQEFGVVTNSSNEIDGLIDLKVRSLIDNKKEITQISLSDQELNKALEKSRLYRKQLKKKNKPQKGFKKSLTNVGLNLIEETRNSPNEEQVGADFSEELDSEIEGLFSTQRDEEKQERQEENLTKGKNILKKKKKRKFIFWLGIASFSLSLVFLALFSIFNFSKTILEKQILLALSGSTDKTIENIDKSMLFRSFSLQVTQYKKIFSEEELTEAIDLENLESMLISAVKNNDEIKQKTFSIYRKTIDGKNGEENLSQDYDQLIALIQEKNQQQKDFNSYLSALNLDLYQGEERATWQKTIDQNRQDLKELAQNERFLTAFKELMFREGRVRILILSQDSSELRGSGGFLTDVSILSFENGYLMDKQTASVNDLDNMIYGRQDAPEEIKSYLGEKNLFLRDSNWWADFPKSAKEIEQFIEQANGEKVDLVIALNSKVDKSILNALGSLSLDGLEINATNFIEKEEQSIVNDYQNENQLSFSSKLNNALLDKFVGLDQDKLDGLLNVFEGQLNNREMLIYSDEQNVQDAVKANSWSGEKLNALCPNGFHQDNCLTDSIFQVEENIGVNKVNPYIKETIQHNIGIGEQFIRHKRTITFENQARESAWPLGVYRDYLKFYLSSQTTLEKVELNGMVIDKSRLSFIDSDYGKELNMLLEIPEESSVELSLTYLVPNQVKSPFSYVFLDQKQSGVFNKKTSYSIVFDERFKPQLIAPQASYQDKIISFENDNSDHFLFAVDFSE